MGLKMVEYQCTSCKQIFEYLEDTREGRVDEPQECPHCGHEGHVFTKVASAPLTKTVVEGNHDFNERQRERLEKRSLEHWKRQGRDEAIDRVREDRKKTEKQLSSLPKS